MYYDEDNVIVEGAMVVWDEITSPEIKDSGKKRWRIKVAVPSTDPQLAEVDAIVQKELRAGPFRGVLPPNGFTPVVDIDPARYEGRLPAHKKITAGTSRGAPQVWDMQQNELDPISYASQLYTGAIVDILVSAWTCIDDRNKGIGLNINGIRIRDSKAPALPVGSSVDSAGAFGPGAAARGPGPGASAPPATSATPVMLPAAQFTYGQYAEAGWSDPQLIAKGFMAPPEALPPGPGPGATVDAPPGPGPSPAAAAPVMTATAKYTYQQYVDADWTDAQLLDAGFISFVGS